MRLAIRGLTRRYGGTAALDSMDLEIASARVLVLIGPSGGGKSTLLRVMGGLEEADEGHVEVNGTVLGNDPGQLLAWRRRNGFLFQQFNLFPHLTALSNITLPLEKVHRFSPEKAAKTAADAMDRLGLTGHGHKLPVQLSGGQQQRVGLARAIAAVPEILILDEPTSALDPEMTAEVLEVIEELAAAGQDIILSTHEMGFARSVGDRIALVASGKIAEEGPPEQVFDASQAALTRKFLSRVMQFMPGRPGSTS